MNKKIFGIILCFLLLLTLKPITIGRLTLDKEADVQVSGDDAFFGIIIGIISDLHRFKSDEQITCQAVNVKYKGTILILPPHAIMEVEGQLFTGELQIHKPYIGMILRHFVCALVAADSNIFIS